MQEMKNRKKYYDEINIARGITVLCVLLGHAFPDTQTGMTHPVAIFIYTMIYSFHMGCFFLLSGFVSAPGLCSEKVDLKREITKKTKRLAIPYLFYSLITMGLKQVFSAFANNQFDIREIWKIFLGENPNGGLWFLWTLFIISVLIMIINQFTHNIRSYCIFAIILACLEFVVADSFLKPVFHYTLFYVAGMLLQHEYVYAGRFIKSNAGFVMGCITLIILAISAIWLKLPYQVTCFLGSFVILVASVHIGYNKDSKIYKIFNEIGMYGYDIYLVSYFVQIPIRVLLYKIAGMEYWFVVVLMFMLGAVIPYYISKYVLRKISITNKVMLGNWK